MKKIIKVLLVSILFLGIITQKNVRSICAERTNYTVQGSSNETPNEGVSFYGINTWDGNEPVYCWNYRSTPPQKTGGYTDWYSDGDADASLLWANSGNTPSNLPYNETDAKKMYNLTQAVLSYGYPNDKGGILAAISNDENAPESVKNMDNNTIKLYFRWSTQRMIWLISNQDYSRLVANSDFQTDDENMSNMITDTTASQYIFNKLFEKVKASQDADFADVKNNTKIELLLPGTQTTAPRQRLVRATTSASPTPSITNTTVNYNNTDSDEGNVVEATLNNGDSLSFKDKVALTGLTSGTTYKIKYEVYDKANTETPITSNSNTTITASGATHTETLNITIPADKIADGKSYSVKTELLDNSGASFIPAIIHNADLNIDAETIKVKVNPASTTPTISNTTVKYNNTPSTDTTPVEAEIEENTALSLTDTVELSGLTANTSYKIKYEVFDTSNTKEAVVTNSDTSFTSSGTTHNLDLSITIPANKIENGKSYTVKTELLNSEGNSLSPAVIHNGSFNLNKETIKVKTKQQVEPARIINTIVKVGDKSGKVELSLEEATQLTTFVDLVEIKNLDSSKEYVLKGTLYDVDNSGVVCNGTDVSIKNKEGNFNTEMTFNMSEKKLEKGHTYSIIQKLYVIDGTEEKEISSHNGNLKAESETIVVSDPGDPVKPDPKPDKPNKPTTKTYITPKTGVE